MTSRVPNRRIAAEAADWAVRIDAGPLDVGEKARLAEWLTTSPVHVDELLFNASLMAGLTHVDTDRSISVEALLADIAPEIIPLFHAQDASSEDALPDDRLVAAQAPTPRGLTRYWPAIAASLLVVVVGSWYGLNHASAPQGDTLGEDAKLIAAAGAEPQPIALADGSVLYMNRETRARVGFSQARRAVELIEGQAIFDVAHDRDRPFQVFAADTKIEAIGTKFLVEYGADQVTVTVMEGKVRVSARNRASAAGGALARVDSSIARHPVELTAEQTALVFANGETRTGSAGAGTPSVWQARHLTYKNESLSVIAAEFNRFNAVKIAVADPELATARFSGVFDAHDPEAFIAFLELTAGVHVDRPREGQVVLTMMD